MDKIWYARAGAKIRQSYYFIGIGTKASEKTRDLEYQESIIGHIYFGTSRPIGIYYSGGFSYLPDGSVYRMLLGGYPRKSL